MKNSCAARLLSSSFGTVSMGQSMQTLDVLALDNLFIGTPCAMSHWQELPMHHDIDLHTSFFKT